ncbi:hypothetical protein Ccrd_024619 [Cynara cardunculus var. scolymus]|uniref:FAD/NAD(P)-binding domain-containing protein n=1 Tax=Cynara cardunculus var. scolymus TaxID=59895 RepID=A0A118JRQ5_CYNCS|nr:hypothetical protein Ccrd_024619 [Cynara cardunculus var. scolymus]
MAVALATVERAGCGWPVVATGQQAVDRATQQLAATSRRAVAVVGGAGLTDSAAVAGCTPNHSMADSAAVGGDLAAGGGSNEWTNPTVSIDDVSDRLWCNYEGLLSLELGPLTMAVGYYISEEQANFQGKDGRQEESLSSFYLADPFSKKDWYDSKAPSLFSTRNVGGHGAALHAVEKDRLNIVIVEARNSISGSPWLYSAHPTNVDFWMIKFAFHPAGLKTAIIEGDVVGGTYVNRGCVSSKALLAVSGRMRELQNEHHMKSFGLQVVAAVYDRQQVADHAQNLATKIQNNLTNSMKSLGVDILTGFGTVVGPQKVKYGKVGGTIPEWIVIVGSGYIGLEFSDVYTTLGSDFCRSIKSVDAWFDPENGKLAQRVLINPRKIDYHTGVFACKVLSINELDTEEDIGKVISDDI